MNPFGALAASELLMEVAEHPQSVASDWIDVRTRDEFSAYRIPGCRSIPLDELEAWMPMLPKDRALVVVCEAGIRATDAANRLNSAGFRAQVLPGGISAWKRAGEPIEGDGGRWSLERQVRFTAGLLAAVGSAGALLGYAAFAGLSLFIGAGLMFAGITNRCGLAMVLARLPWNQRKS